MKDILKLKMESLDDFIKQFEKETKGKKSCDVAVAVWAMANDYHKEAREQMADEYSIDHWCEDED